MRSIGCLLLCIVALSASCDRTKRKVGLGRWRVDKTVLRDATGRCVDTTLPDGRAGTWCFGQPALALAKQTADVDLYFGGREPTSPLIEIFIKVRACDEAATIAWLRGEFGAPDASLANRVIWQALPALRIVAVIPAKAGRCTLRFFPVTEQAEFERVRDGLDRETVPAGSTGAGDQAVTP